MEKDLTRICKGELSTEGLFDKMRIESKKFFETVQNRIDDLQNNLENYLAHGLKNDDYIKLNEIDTEPNLNENEREHPKNQSNKSNNKSHKPINNSESFINENIDFSNELEENEKSKAETEEIIKSILYDKNKNKPNNDKSKLKFENNLRGILNIGKKKMESDDSSETEVNSIGKSNDSLSREKDILKLENKCPSCKTANLKLLKNKSTFAYFIGCSGFPKCSFIKSINNPRKVRISDEFCPTCKEKNRKTLLFELEFNNLNNNNDITKEECFVCLLENDPKIKNSSAYNKNGNQGQSYKKPYYQNNNSNFKYKNSFYNGKPKKDQPQEE